MKPYEGQCVRNKSMKEKCNQVQRNKQNKNVKAKNAEMFVTYQYLVDNASCKNKLGLKFRK